MDNGHDGRREVLASLPQRVEDALAEQIEPSRNMGRQVPYAPPSPPSTDPVVLAGQTVKSVYTIGGTAADEVEAAADELESAAHTIATELRRLGEALRKASEHMGRDVELFAGKATTVLNGVRGLMAQMGAQELPHDPNG